MNMLFNFVLVIVILLMGELYLRPAAASLFFLAANNVHPLVAPLWIALPNVIWYAIIAALMTWRARQRALLCNSVIFFIAAALMWQVQYPNGIWISEDILSYVLALAPMAALPIGMILGFLVTRSLLKAKNGAD